MPTTILKPSPWPAENPPKNRCVPVSEQKRANLGNAGYNTDSETPRLRGSYHGACGTEAQADSRASEADVSRGGGSQPADRGAVRQRRVRDCAEPTGGH